MKKSPLIDEFAEYGRITSCIGRDDLGSTLQSRLESGRSRRVDPHANLEQLDETTPTIHLRRRKYASHV